VREGTRARSTLRSQGDSRRFLFQDELRRGVACGWARTAATCRELLCGETPLGTFVRVEGVEPTNHEAARARRPGVS
jgi:transposase